MTNDQDKSSVLKDKEKFGKHPSGAGKDDASAREELKHMSDRHAAEKAKSAGSPGGSKK